MNCSDQTKTFCSDFHTFQLPLTLTCGEMAKKENQTNSFPQNGEDVVHDGTITAESLSIVLLVDGASMSSEFEWMTG